MEPNIHDVERRDRRGRRLPAFVALALVVVIGATWAGLVGFLGSNAAFGTAEGIEEAYVCDVNALDLAFPDLSTLSEVSTADGVELGKLTERNSQPIPLAEVPDLVVAAVLSAEDKDFYSHEGISFKAIFRAAIANYGSSSVQGGSTITQQVAKQNFLSADQTIERKVCEAVLAAELEERYTKDQILEFYINSIFYGANAYGVKAASQEYFGKDLDELTIAEAAMLVAPIRNPSFYHPRLFPENVIAARNRTLDQMAANGFVTRADAQAAKSSELGVIPHQGFEDLSPQVMIAVRSELLGDDANRYGLGSTYAERKQAVFGCPAADSMCEGGGGLKIFVTVDYRLQEAANAILRSWFRPGFTGPTGAIAMVDNYTGAVRVMASGLDFGTDIEAGQRPYDLATQGQRQPGSAFKPFTLAAALEHGDLEGNPITLGSYWDRSSPAEIDCGFPCSEGGNIWTVNNAGGNTPRSLESLEAATYNSRNTVYARVVEAVGPQHVVDTAHELGIESALQPYPSITLGAFGVSPLEMATAYSTIANYGDRIEPYLIERIESADGEVIYRHEVERRRVLDESLSAAMVSTLEQVVERGTGRRADIGRPQAGKTGTATDYRDVWFVGFIPQYSTAVWVGYADAQIPMEDFTVFNAVEGEEQFYNRAFGGTLAAPIWQQFMLEATAGLRVVDFRSDPEGTDRYRQTPFRTVPDLAESTAVEAIDLVFSLGLEPELVEVNSLMPEGTIVGQDPLPETRLQQGNTVTVEVSNGLPPEAPIPDLQGLLTIQVSPALTAFTEATGVAVTWVAQDQADPNPGTWGRVVGTNPPAGTTITDGQLITVLIGKKP
jgi:penicillin-binding protein 1A